jgi:FtsP/CotA-like multicopper oxidase with cupredoxin domain
MLRKALFTGSASIAALALVGALAFIGHAWWTSRLPGTYSVMDYGAPDYGGGALHNHAHGQSGISVAVLSGTAAGTPDARFTLRASHAVVRLASGQKLDALAFNGGVPGPELRVRQGDLVEVTLVNEDIEDGVSLHWHGVDVPNASDGVAGVTQDAVRPGERFVYRFRVHQAGSFWYHTHQDPSRNVARGLFGAFVIEPRGKRPPREVVDMPLLVHDADGALALNGAVGSSRRAVPTGTAVRLRLVNTENSPLRLAVAGTPFRVLAIDGTDLRGPTQLEGTALPLAAGGRYDVRFTMPHTAVSVGLPGTRARLVLSPDGRADLPAPPDGPDFDPAAYGTPAPAPFGASSRFARRFRLTIGRKPGFFDGHPGLQWTINGHIYPDVPVFVVRRDDLVSIEIDNRTGSTHPMHLHGQHVLVLSRNGRPVRGGPWWADTLDVGPHERYDVAFRASNPGIWMYHCHNLRHAADGLTMHVAYEGVHTPFLAGGAAHNHPE